MESTANARLHPYMAFDNKHVFKNNICKKKKTLNFINSTKKFGNENILQQEKV
jgi:hypothetical protein